jgi:HSP20 family protein
MNLRSLFPVERERALQANAGNAAVSLQQEIQRLFDDFGRNIPKFGAVDVIPKMDILEKDNIIEVTAELPGLEEKDVEIDFADNVLTLRGEKKFEKEEKDKNYRLLERSYGSFSRAIELPPGTDPANITANIDKGVLKVTIKKPEPKVARKIEVKPS